MLTLSILRHAKSSWDDERLPDFDRPLAPRGREAAPRMGRLMRKIGLRPDLVLCSTAIRTRETARLALAELRSAPAIVYEDELYEASADVLLERLRALPADVHHVLLIAHNPGLHDLALRLVGGSLPPEHERLAAKLPTAALLVLDLDVRRWSDVGRATGRIARYVVPADLSAAP